ncbi:hypothetical protein F4553_001927 [Allocatelliglobosispora scoriae]|uniref:Uncharacterized protein n=1 Tax=Allocatelliglobosispora scoriae TaxID=643052 RepID=A0A841BMF1_9ACTN|nr:hypothetical protein [Allocatelliglobosispora scoriae]MBB5868548.1 hypothetical protein [Allocatelliglobosispora scoriae]
MQRSTGSTKERSAFFVNITLNPVPWVAWTRRTSLSEVRATPPAENEGVWDGRLASTSNWHGVWEVTAATLDDVCEQLAGALRTELAEKWIPLLPRDAFRALLRERRNAPGIVGSPRIADLLCRIEDVSEADRKELISLFERRGREGDQTLGELAEWMRRAF